MRGCLPGVSPSSGAYRATFPPRGEGFSGGGMRSPRPTSQFYRNLSSRVPILSMCARGAHSVFIIFYLLSILPRRGTLVPDGAPIRSIPGNCNKKTALLPPLICTLHSFPRGLSRALKTPHRGVFAPRYAKRGISTCGYRIEQRPLMWLVLCDRCACSGSLFPPQAAVTSAASCSRPRWRTDPQHPGKSQ